MLRNTVFCFVGGATFMVIFYGRRSTVLPASSWPNRVGLVATALVCVYGVYYDPSLPLSWLLLVPSVWGGLTLTVRGTAYLILTVVADRRGDGLPARTSTSGTTGCCRPRRSSTCWSSSVRPSPCC